MAMTSKQVNDIVAKRNAKLADQQRPKGLRRRRLPASALYGQLGQADAQTIAAVERVVKGLTFKTRT